MEAAYSMDTPPEVVIEIGPHRTLVGPLLQVTTTGQQDGGGGTEAEGRWRCA